MKLYKLTFSAQGPCTKLPDAQALFGALCQGILNHAGHEKLQEYLSSFDHEPLFIHSAMYPDGFYPSVKKPVFELKDLQNSIKRIRVDSRLDVISQTKGLKKVSYLSQRAFERYLLNDRLNDLPREIEKSEVYVRTQGGLSFIDCRNETVDVPPFEMKSLLIAKNGSQNNEIEKELFYKKTIYFSDSSRFMVFVKSDQPIQRIRGFFEWLKFVGIGPRRSTGMNLFNLENIEEISIKKCTDYAFLLSDCIPAKGEFNYEQSSYSVRSELYRGSFLSVQDKIYGRFNSLESGSLMKPVKVKPYYGRLIPIQIQGKTVYHYGIGFTL